MKSILKCLATGFGAGYVPIAPGTAGTLVGIPIYLLLSSFPGHVYFFILVALTLFAVWASNETLVFFEDLSKSHDPRQIVIDEIVGFLYTAGILQHIGGWEPQKNWFLFLTAVFLAFRFFDVVKIWPASFAEQKFVRGWGIVFDDVIAGILAALALLLLSVIFSSHFRGF